MRAVDFRRVWWCLAVAAMVFTSSFFCGFAAGSAGGWEVAAPTGVEVEPEGSGAEILPGGSVELFESSVWQEVTLEFGWEKGREAGQIRFEILPGKKGLGQRGKRLILFDLKAYVVRKGGKVEALMFSKCTFLGNPGDTYAAHCIDFLSDTGWSVPALKPGQDRHVLAFVFEKALKLEAGDRLELVFDSGGSAGLDVFSRVRIQLPAAARRGRG